MQPPRPFLAFGPQQCTDLPVASHLEWLVADGVGGYAMGTVAGLRRRRYHALQVVAGDEIGRRHVGLVALETVLVLGDRQVRLACDAWGNGVIDPSGHELLVGFDLTDGVPRWRWQIGDVIVEREVAARHGEPTIAIVHRVVRAPAPVRIVMTPLCTWRDAHGSRRADGGPGVEPVDWGFVFEGRYRVDGPLWQPGGGWYRDVYLGEEAERGLDAREDVAAVGTFTAVLAPGAAAGVVVRAGAPFDQPAPEGELVVHAARRRARDVLTSAAAADAVDAQLVLAADQFVVEHAGTPAIVAGYPWFGSWGRDTMIGVEGLLLATNRHTEARALLDAWGASVDEGLVANTTDSGTPERNTIDATLWFLHALDRYVAATDDHDLVASLATTLASILAAHLQGTRHGIGVDPVDGLVRGGEDGVALTWMDARVDGRVVTPRRGKPVEVNALWVNGLAAMANRLTRVGADADPWRRAHALASESFARFVRVDGRGLHDVIDGDATDLDLVRPNQLLAVSLPHGPVRDANVVRSIVQVCAPLVTPLGLRTLAPDAPAYRGTHRGDRTARDEAYHQGTVWPWLVGPYADTCRRGAVDVTGVLDGLERHLAEWGAGSVSETADGDPPHRATGCPFQAWSVAEVLRVRRTSGPTTLS